MLLQEAFNEADVRLPDAPASNPSPERRRVIRQGDVACGQIGARLSVVIVAGVGPVQRLLEFSSVESLVNARLVTLRPPIEGELRTPIPQLRGSILQAERRGIG